MHERPKSLEFEDLLREHERKVLHVALKLTGNLEDAKDVAQEVFLRLHRHLPELKHQPVAPWLYRVTMNLAADQRRRVRRRPAGPLLGVFRAKSSPPDLHMQLAEALAQLGEKERAALVLREVEGLSTAEVAEMLDSTESTVRVQISKARLKLRELLRGVR